MFKSKAKPTVDADPFPDLPEIEVSDHLGDEGTYFGDDDGDVTITLSAVDAGNLLRVARNYSVSDAWRSGWTPETAREVMTAVMALHDALDRKWVR